MNDWWLKTFSDKQKINNRRTIQIHVPVCRCLKYTHEFLKTHGQTHQLHVKTRQMRQAVSRHTDRRQTNIMTSRQVEREERKTGRQTDRQIRQADRQADRQTRQTDRQTSRQTEINASRQTGTGQAGRQTGRQSKKERKQERCIKYM